MTINRGERMADDIQAAKADAAAEKARAKAMRPWYKKKRFLLPLVLVLIVVIASIAGGGDDDSKVATDGTTTTSGDGGGAKKANTLFPGRPDAKKADIERNVGQSAELSGYTVTIVKAGFQGEISEFEKDGYLVADVTVLNRDDKAQSYNVFEWKLITPAGQIIDPTITSKKQLGSGDLAKDGTVSGQVIWEVGSQKGDYYVIYDPADFGDERGVWKATI